MRICMSMSSGAAGWRGRPANQLIWGHLRLALRLVRPGPKGAGAG